MRMDVRVAEKNVHHPDVTYGSDSKTLGKDSDIRTGSDGINMESVDNKSIARKSDSDDRTTINMEKVAESVVVGRDAIQKNPIKGTKEDKDTADSVQEDTKKVIRCTGDNEHSQGHSNITGVTEAGKAMNNEAAKPDAGKASDLTKERASGAGDKDEVSGQDITAKSRNIEATTNNDTKDIQQGTPVGRSKPTEENIGKIKEKKEEDDLSGFIVSTTSGNFETATYKGNKDNMERTKVVSSKKAEDNIENNKDKDDLIDNNFSRDALKKSPVKQEEGRGANDDILSDRIRNLGQDAPKSSATEEIDIKSWDKNTDCNTKQSNVILTKVEKSRENSNIANTDKSQSDDVKKNIMEGNDENKTDIPAGIGSTEKKECKEFSDKAHDVQNNAIGTGDKCEATTCRATISPTKCNIKESTSERGTTKTNSIQIIRGKDCASQHDKGDKGLETAHIKHISDKSRITKDNDVMWSKEAKPDIKRTNVNTEAGVVKSTVISNKEKVKGKDDKSGKDLPKTSVSEKELKTRTVEDDPADGNGMRGDAVPETLWVSTVKEKPPATTSTESSATKIEEITGGSKTRAEVTDEYGITQKTIVVSNVRDTNLTTTRNKSYPADTSATARNTNQKELTKVIHNDNTLKGDEDYCSQAKTNVSNTREKQQPSGSYGANDNAINVDRIEITKKELSRMTYGFRYNTRTESVSSPIDRNTNSKCRNTDVGTLHDAIIKQSTADVSTSDANSAKQTLKEDGNVDSVTGRYTPNPGRIEKGSATRDEKETFTESDTNAKQSRIAYEMSQKGVADGQEPNSNTQTNRHKTGVTNSCVIGISTVASGGREVEGTASVEKRDPDEGSVIAAEDAVSKDEEAMAVGTNGGKLMDTAITKADAKSRERNETTPRQLTEVFHQTPENERRNSNIQKRNEISKTISGSEVESQAGCCPTYEDQSKDRLMIIDEAENDKDDAIESSVIRTDTNQRELTDVKDNENGSELREVNSSSELNGNMSTNLDDDGVGSSDDTSNRAKKTDIGRIRRNEHMKEDVARRSTRMETLAEEYYMRGFIDYNVKCSGRDRFDVNNNYAAYNRRDAYETSEVRGYDSRRNVDHCSKAIARNIIRRSQNANSGGHYNTNNVGNNAITMDSVCRSNMIPVTRTNYIKARRGVRDFRRLPQTNRAPHVMLHRGPSQTAVDERVQCVKAASRSGVDSPAWTKQGLRHTEYTNYQMADMARHDKGSKPENAVRYVSEKGQNQLLETNLTTDNRPYMQENMRYAIRADAGEYAKKEVSFSYNQQVPQRPITISKERRKKSSRSTAKNEVTEDDVIHDNKAKKMTNESEGNDKVITRRSKDASSRRSKQELAKKGIEGQRRPKKSAGGSVTENVAKPSEPKSEVPKNLFQKFMDVLTDALDSFIPSDEDSESEAKTDSDSASVATKPKRTKGKLEHREDSPSRIAENSAHNEKWVKSKKPAEVLEDRHKKTRNQKEEQQLSDPRLILPDNTPNTKDVQTNSATSKATKQKSSEVSVEDDATVNYGISNNATKKRTTKGSVRETGTARRSSKVTSEQDLVKSGVTKQQHKNTSTGSEEKTSSGLYYTSPETRPSPRELPKKTVFHRFVDAITTSHEPSDASYRKPSLCAEIYNSLAKPKRATESVSGGDRVQEENATVYSGNRDEVRKTKHRRGGVRVKEGDATKDAGDRCLMTENNTSTTYVIQAEVHATDEQPGPATTANYPDDELPIPNNVGEDNVTLAEIIADDLRAETAFQNYFDVKHSLVTSGPGLSPVEEVDEMDNETVYYFALEDDGNHSSGTPDKPAMTTVGRTAEDGILQNGPVLNDGSSGHEFQTLQASDCPHPGPSSDGCTLATRAAGGTTAGTATDDNPTVGDVRRLDKTTSDDKAKESATQYDLIQKGDQRDDLAGDFLQHSSLTEDCSVKKLPSLEEHTSPAISRHDSVSCKMITEQIGDVTVQDSAGKDCSHLEDTSLSKGNNDLEKPQPLVEHRSAEKDELGEAASQDDNTDARDDDDPKAEFASRDPETDSITTRPDPTCGPSDDSFSWDFSSKDSPADGSPAEAGRCRNDVVREDKSGGSISADGAKQTARARSTAADKDGGGQESAARNGAGGINADERDPHRSLVSGKCFSDSHLDNGSPALDCSSVECIASGDKEHHSADKHEDSTPDLTHTGTNCSC